MKVSVGPTPGTLRSSSSCSRHTGLSRSRLLRSSSISFNSCFSSASTRSIRTWTTGRACWRRTCSETLILTTCRRRVTRASSSSAAAEGNGRGSTSAAWPKCAITSASIRSVLASLPRERAKSRTWRGFTTAIGKPEAPKAAAIRRSYPPDASIITRRGRSCCRRRVSVATPASS